MLNRINIRMHIFSYALLWSGATEAITNQFPSENFPSSNPARFEQDGFNEKGLPWKVSAIIAIEDNRVAVNIDWHDGTPKEYHIADIPMINLDFPLGIENILENYRFELLT